MSDLSVSHETFVIERTFDAPPPAVFGAWADPSAKTQWFGAPDTDNHHTMEFAVGGRESAGGAIPNGPTYTYEAVYHDIVEHLRIVYTYEMELDGRRISVSVATVTFEAHGASTRMRYTEQGAYLDGLDTVTQREHGTRELFDALERHLRQVAPAG